jgi:hypothetical protein
MNKNMIFNDINLVVIIFYIFSCNRLPLFCERGMRLINKGLDLEKMEIPLHF